MSATFSEILSDQQNNLGYGDGDETGFVVKENGSLSVSVSVSGSTVTGSGTATSNLSGYATGDSDGDSDAFQNPGSGRVSVTGTLSDVNITGDLNNGETFTFTGSFNNARTAINGTVQIDDPNLSGFTPFTFSATLGTASGTLQKSSLINFNNGATVAGFGLSAYAVYAGAVTGGLSALGEVLGVIGVYYVAKAFADPFDPNYQTVYIPTLQTPPTITIGTTIAPATAAEQQLANDANSAFAYGSQADSYLQAVVVSENRFNSAIQEGDQASSTLQNAAVSKYLSLGSSALHSFANGLDTVASDLQADNLNGSIPSQDVSNFLNSLQTQGFAALPAQEQSIIDSFGLTPADDQSLVNQLLSINPAQAPSSLAAALEADASALNGIATVYSNSVPDDFLGNGTSDVLLQNDGTVADWIMQNGQYASGNILSTAAAGWTVVGAGDFTGNGTSDVLLQNGGTVVDWLMQDGQYSNGNVLTAGASGWSVVGTGDFTGNGVSDVLLQNGGTVADWIMQNGQYESGNILTTAAAGWNVVGTGDFTGNGTDDVLLQNGGTVADWIIQNGQYETGNILTTAAAGWKVVGTGDFTGNGTDDVLLQNGGTVVDWIMHNGQYETGNVLTTAAAGWTVVGAGDFTGNGTSDILLQNGSTVAEWVMNNGAYQSGSILTTNATGWKVVNGAG